MVTDLRVELRLVDAPAADTRHPCTLEDFTVTQPAGDLELTLAARASQRLSDLSLPGTRWPQVGMVDSAANQDGCKGATLTLEYAATGRSGS